MGIPEILRRKLTQTKALEETSGQFETDFFEPVYRVLYLLGLSSSVRGGIYLLYSSTIRLMILAFVFSELWYLFSMSSTLDSIIDNANVTLIHLIAMYRYFNMLYHKVIYKNLAMSMESQHFDISTNERRRILGFWLTNNNRYFRLLLTLGTCTLAVWYLYPLVDDLEYNLVVTVRVPFDFDSPTRYAITYAVVVLAFQYTSYFVMVNDLIMQSHLMHLLCQYSVLGNCFENILEDCSRGITGLDESNLHLNEEFTQKYLKRLGNLVQQHTFILNNTLELRSILSTPMLCQLAASSMLICFAGYQVTATAMTADITKFLMSLFYLSYNMFQLFIFCKWCDEIKLQSAYIREAAYFSGWERMAMVSGVRARLMIIVARASRSLVLTAGGICDLSLNSYATIVKTSYSALSVLLRTRRE